MSIENNPFNQQEGEHKIDLTEAESPEPKSDPVTLEIPTRYQGMPADVVEEMWTIPYYADPAKTAAEKAAKVEAIAKLREQQVTDEKIQDVRRRLRLIEDQPVQDQPVQDQPVQDQPVQVEVVQQDSQEIAESIIPENIAPEENVPNNTAPQEVSLEQVQTLETGISPEKTAAFVEKIATLTAILDKERGMLVDSEDFISQLKEVFDESQEHVDNAYKLAEQINASLGRETKFLETTVSALHNNQDYLQQLTEGRHFYNNEAKKSLGTLKASINSIINEHKRIFG